MQDKVKILIIDDDTAISKALEILISAQGWQGICAIDGFTGIELLKKEKPDLVLVDYHMPRMNGIECVAAMRKIAEKTPIIVFTIDERQELADRFMLAGANDFATKPIKGPDIISRIRLHLKILGIEKETIARQENTAHPYLAKGIGNATLKIITDAMSDTTDYMTVEEISQKSGLAYQTTYRYLQYMSNENIVEIISSYGKIGRPKQEYRLKQ